MFASLLATFIPTSKPSYKDLTLSNHLIGNSIAADHPAAQIHILGHDAGISTVRFDHDAVAGRRHEGHRTVSPNQQLSMKRSSQFMLASASQE